MAKRNIHTGSRLDALPEAEGMAALAAEELGRYITTMFVKLCERGETVTVSDPAWSRQHGTLKQWLREELDLHYAPWEEER